MNVLHTYYVYYRNIYYTYYSITYTCYIHIAYITGTYITYITVLHVLHMTNLIYVCHCILLCIVKEEGALCTPRCTGAFFVGLSCLQGPVFTSLLHVIYVIHVICVICVIYVIYVTYVTYVIYGRSCFFLLLYYM